jgi:hypothetical protein
MRKIFAGLVAGVVLASTGTVGAAPAGPTSKAYGLLPGQAVTFAGLTCTAYKGTTPSNSNLVCVRNNLVGYGVVVSQSAVVVAKRINGNVKIFFKAANR